MRDRAGRKQRARRGDRGSGRGGVASAATGDRPPADGSTRRAQLRFALTFVGVAAVLFAVYAFPYAPHGPAARVFESYLSAYARLAGRLVWVFDRQASVAGNVIEGRYSLRIVKTCDAMEANMLFLAAMVAFPAPWRRKLLAAAAGIVGLIVANVLRIGSLYLIGVYAPHSFDLFHAELWPPVLVAIALCEFLLLVRWIGRVPA
jgi:exosortase/archaeosortase family protein